MIKLHQVRRWGNGGTEVLWVNPLHIIAVYPTKDEKHPSVRAIVMAQGYTWAVEETDHEISSQI